MDDHSDEPSRTRALIFPPTPVGFSDASLNWKAYEAYILGRLRSLMPGAKIAPNVKIRGQKSRRLRQIDILVERSLGTFGLQIAVDCKAYGRKVTVNDVERFLGMLDDLRVSKGVLMTTKGYTKAALERAQNESRDVELRILSIERLTEFQWIGSGILWRGPVAALISAPESWVIDNQHTHIPQESSGNIPHFVSYPLGHTRETAVRTEAFIYGTIILKCPGRSTVDEIALWHERQVLEEYPTAVFERLTPARVSREESVYFRVGRVHSGYRGPEYSIYLDHPKGALLLVLMCPEGRDGLCVPLLEAMAQHAILLDCDDSKVADGIIDITPIGAPNQRDRCAQPRKG